ncbi:hypothetical protein CVU37_10225 [candidate division BRC1 bacterium HGW-BRC1-1]|nr:MAG: hypothetical protein CVU37_10225 [candidate division BRC1 bacterium HGW-BRC1-1]
MLVWGTALSISGVILLSSDSVYYAVLGYAKSELPMLFSGSSNIAEFSSDFNALYLALFHFSGFVIWRYSYSTSSASVAEEVKVASAGREGLRLRSDSDFMNRVLIFGTGILFIAAVILDVRRGEAPFVILFLPVIAFATVAPPICFWYDPSGHRTGTVAAFALSVASTLLGLFGFWGALVQFVFLVLLALAIRAVKKQPEKRRPSGPPTEPCSVSSNNSRAS